MWNCYLAHPGTMDEAIFMGSLRMSVVGEHPDIKQAFMEVMMDTLRVTIRDVLGQEPSDMVVEDAPEHERSGHG